MSNRDKVLECLDRIGELFPRDASFLQEEFDRLSKPASTSFVEQSPVGDGVFSGNFRTHRRNDCSTSRVAGEVVEKSLAMSKLRVQVLYELYKKPMTDDELEALPIFCRYAQTTVGKRRTELYQHNLVEIAGEDSTGRTPKFRWRLSISGQSKVLELLGRGEKGLS